MASMEEFETDSDDGGVFFGPVTAKELEWMWRNGFKVPRSEPESADNPDVAFQQVPAPGEVSLDHADLENSSSYVGEVKKVSLGPGNCLKGESLQLLLSNGDSLHYVDDDTSDTEDSPLQKSEIGTLPDNSSIPSNCLINTIENTKGLGLNDSELISKENTLIDKSMISVKGDNQYEVYIPFTPASKTFMNSSTYHELLQTQEKTFADKSMVSVKGENRYEVYIPTVHKNLFDSTRHEFEGNTTLDSTGFSDVTKIEALVENSFNIGINGSCIDNKADEPVTVSPIKNLKMSVKAVLNSSNASTSKTSCSNNFFSPVSNGSFISTSEDFNTVLNVSEFVNKSDDSEGPSTSPLQVNAQVEKEHTLMETLVGIEVSKENPITNSENQNVLMNVETEKSEAPYLTHNSLVVEAEETISSCVSNEVIISHAENISIVDHCEIKATLTPMKNEVVSQASNNDLLVFCDSENVLNVGETEIVGNDNGLDLLTSELPNSAQIESHNSSKIEEPPLMETEEPANCLVSKIVDVNTEITNMPQVENDILSKVVEPSAVEDTVMETEGASGCQVSGSEGIKSEVRNVSQEHEKNMSHNEAVFPLIPSLMEVEVSSHYQVPDNGLVIISDNTNLLESGDGEIVNQISNLDLEGIEIPPVNESKQLESDVASNVVIPAEPAEAAEIKSDSSDKSFVSLTSQDETDRVGNHDDTCYSPPGKKQCKQKTPYKNKENQEPSVKKPPPSSSRLPVLKPATLRVDSNLPSPWVPDFKKKKIPPPKKPDYVVSPNKLDRLLKKTPVSSVRPQTAPNRTPMSQHNVGAFSTPQSEAMTLKFRPQSAIARKTPASTRNQTTPTKSKIPSLSSSVNLKNVRSPVAEYIKSPLVPTLKNVTPKGKGKIENEQPKGPVKASPKPTVSLNPVYYSSARNRMVVPSKSNSPTLPKMGERQTSVLVTPKHHVFKHIGRVNSEEKKGSESMNKKKSTLCDNSVSQLPKKSIMNLDTSVVQQVL